MAAQTTVYQCPNCAGPLRFAGASGFLECEYCLSRFETSEIERLYSDKEKAAELAAKAAETAPEWNISEAGGSWSAEEASHLRSYTCPACAAELICDDTTAASSCPYCGNPTVIPGQFADKLRPDLVIPFKIDKNAAVEALCRHYAGKRFLPKVFKDENHIEEIKGVYVPFWLFDAVCDANVKYTGTKVSSRRAGDTEIITTEYYNIVRHGKMAFSKIPADGSRKMPDAHMDAIEPFNYAELTPFKTAYLPGFLADKYDVPAEECSKRTDERIKVSAKDALTATVHGYTTLTVDRSVINIKEGAVKYALLPVWMLYTKWNGKSYLFAANGQTGKLIGDLPVDWKRFWAVFLTLAAPLAAVFFAVLNIVL